MEEFEIITLNNGIRVAFQPVSNTNIVHCGFVLDIGSRDEKADQQGLAHFWEHMVFKGTKKRKAYHIINRLDSVGGELNAQTSKEKICFHASVLNRHFNNAVDLLTDITFDSVFPEKHIELERKVILEEMSMYHDAPEEAIQDEFDELIFQNHPLGNNILGTKKSVKSFSKEDFNHFVYENLDTSRIIFTVVGNISKQKLKRAVNKYIAPVPEMRSEHIREPFNSYKPSYKTVYRDLVQSQYALGRPAYHLYNENRLPFFMLVNILGGPSMNSRLNLALREKYGFVYAVDADYQAYTDTGMLAVYFGTEPGQVDKCVNRIFKEMRSLKDKPLGTMQLHKAKEQLKGQIAMDAENNRSMMIGMGRSLLDKDKIKSLEEIFKEIDDISARQLQSVAQDMFDENMYSHLKYLPDALS